ncbi:MAG: glycosyltransferase family 4 protein [Planctomycetes bacterium]|nr:glycosyltransferase family 4 protein [Planctomycetota bacterium]
MRELILGIDASNIRAGGGLTHLRQTLEAAQPDKHGIGTVIVWSGSQTLRVLPERDWLIKTAVPMLDGPLPMRLLWQQLLLPYCLRESGCDILFSPGGTLPRCIKIPAVVMPQNLLVFDEIEADRYKPNSFMRYRLRLLHRSQSKSLRRANGIVFLTEFAKKAIIPSWHNPEAQSVIVPHGIEERFFAAPRKAREFSECSEENPFHLLYVSIIDVYKHQWHVAEAVAELRKEGIPVEISFVGPAYEPALKRLQAAIAKLDPQGKFLHYPGPLPFEELHAAYQQADAFAFASSCENLPIILLEAMASGLPIACSKRGPMPGVLGKAGEYFDPESPEEITTALQRLIMSPELREKLAQVSYQKARGYTWEKCADGLFAFLSRIARKKD